MSGNDTTYNDSHWRNHLCIYFGPHLASKALDPFEILKPSEVPYINERFIYPDIRPIYRVLRKTELSVANWSDALIYILRCKCVP